MGQVATNFAYLATIVCFILALRFLSHPSTARRGNWIGAVGMLIAVVVTFAQISVAEFHNSAPDPGRLHGDISVSIILSALIGSISFAGSMVAFAKLQELIQGRPIVYPGQQVVNALLLAAIVAAGIAIVAGAAGTDGGTVRSASADDVAVMLAYAHKVVFVPGYGMAVAQAQHDVHQLADLLEQRGVEVSYAIHPVAGRMPGHMNVLLAEANVPYPQLKEMDEANPEFSRTDVAVVIGANDVTNPDARNNKGSPIYGMPILNVDQANAVVVLKRSMNPGFAGIENPLFYNPKTVMLFGDAKDSITKLIAAVKTL